MEPIVIEMEHYPRRAHFEYFTSMANPYVGLTVEVDVARAVRRAKEEGLSPFLCLLYAVGRAANGVPAFRQRVRAGGIVEYPLCKTSHTVMKPDGTYAYCEADPSLPLADFLAAVGEKQRQVLRAGTIVEESGPEGLIFVSCVPWMRYTALVQPTPAPADSNPRITWGKFIPEGEKLVMPLSVLAHHALVDGRQIADFYQAFQEEVEGL